MRAWGGGALRLLRLGELRLERRLLRLAARQRVAALALRAARRLDDFADLLELRLEGGDQAVGALLLDPQPRDLGRTRAQLLLELVELLALLLELRLLLRRLVARRGREECAVRALVVLRLALVVDALIGLLLCARRLVEARLQLRRLRLRRLCDGGLLLEPQLEIGGTDVGDLLVVREAEERLGEAREGDVVRHVEARRSGVGG